MPFDPKSAKKAGKRSKRGPAKKEGPSIKEKMEMLYVRARSFDSSTFMPPKRVNGRVLLTGRSPTDKVI